MDKVYRNGKHYDARGKEVPGYFDLMAWVKEERSLRLLRSHPLCYLVVIPAVTIRLTKGDHDAFYVIKDVRGIGMSRKVLFTERALSALAKTINRGRRGWSVRKTQTGFDVSRETKVIFDNTGKYSR